jgi:heavy metal-binding protein
MSDPRDTTAYVCPMHPEVREARPGRCPTCGMSLVPEGARFTILRHMLGRPMHVALMAGLMIAVVAAAMMMTIR